MATLDNYRKQRQKYYANKVKTGAISAAEAQEMLDMDVSNRTTSDRLKSMDKYGKSKQRVQKNIAKENKEIQRQKEQIKKSELKLGNKYQKYANKVGKQEELKYNKSVAAQKAASSAGTLGEPYFSKPDNSKVVIDSPINSKKNLSVSQLDLGPEPAKLNLKEPYVPPYLRNIASEVSDQESKLPKSTVNKALGAVGSVGKNVIKKTPLGKIAAILGAGVIGKAGYDAYKEEDKPKKEKETNIIPGPSTETGVTTPTLSITDLQKLVQSPTLQTYTPGTYIPTPYTPIAGKFTPIEFTPGTYQAGTYTPGTYIEPSKIEVPKPRDIPMPTRTQGLSNEELTRQYLAGLQDTTPDTIKSLNEMYQSRMAGRAPIEAIDISANEEIKKLNANLEQSLQGLVKAYGSRREVQKAVQQQDPILLQELAAIDAQYNLALNDIQSNYSSALASAERNQQQANELLSQTTNQMLGGFENIAGGLQGMGGGVNISTAALARGLSGAAGAEAGARQFETGVDLLGDIAGARMGQARSESDLAMMRAASKSQSQRSAAVREAEQRERIRQEEIEADKEFIANQQQLAGTIFANAINERDRAESNLRNALERQQSLEIARQKEDENFLFQIQSLILDAQQQGDARREQQATQLFNATLADRKEQRAFEDQLYNRELQQAEQDYNYAVNVYNQESLQEENRRKFLQDEQAAALKFGRDEDLSRREFNYQEDALRRSLAKSEAEFARELNLKENINQSEFLNREAQAQRDFLTKENTTRANIEAENIALANQYQQNLVNTLLSLPANQRDQYLNSILGITSTAGKRPTWYRSTVDGPLTIGKTKDAQGKEKPLKLNKNEVNTVLNYFDAFYDNPMATSINENERFNYWTSVYAIEIPKIAESLGLNNKQFEKLLKQTNRPINANDLVKQQGE